MTKITALIPTFNNEESLSKTLDSLQWVDAILVIDSFSKDNTVAVAKKYGAVVLQHEYLNSAKQKNWAMGFIKTEWTLQLDTDEVLEAGAKDEIRKAITAADTTIECFRLKRKNHMWGKWIRFGGIYPDYENRLFRTAKGRWFDREVHSNIRVLGGYGHLQSNIIHYGMPNISKQLQNLNRYTRYEADELYKRGAKPSFVKQFIYPLGLFAYRYFYQQGFRDGWHGFFLAAYNAFYYFLSRAKLKEMHVLKLKQSPS